MKRIVFTCALVLLAALFIMPEWASAAEEKILDGTIRRYMQDASVWEPTIKQAAKRMFWILATISIVFTGAYMLIRGNASFGDFFGEFLRFGVTTGFFYWLLDNGAAIANSIIRSFAELGIAASSTYQRELSPSNIMWFGMDLIVRSVKTFGDPDIATAIVTLLLAIAIAVLFAIIAAQMVLLLCSAWVLVYAGIIYLGFGGGRWTSDMAINYFKTVLGLAIQTFVFCLLVGIGQQQVERLISESQMQKVIEVPGLVYGVNQVTTTAMTITEACIILVFTVVLFMLVKTVPTMVAGIVSGSSTGGIQLGGAGSTMAAAAAIASGGAMVAMQAAGAGMALNSAYQATKDNKESGEGMFKGASGAGGLAGAMDTGLRSAGDFMSNLMSGAKDAAKDNIQGSTTGGKMSANIDAAMEARQNEREAAGGENQGGNTDSGSSEIGGDAPSGDDGGGGDNSGSSGSGSTGSSGGGGGSSGFGANFDAEWQAALDSYDPSTVGMIEDSDNTREEWLSQMSHDPSTVGLPDSE